MKFFEKLKSSSHLRRVLLIIVRLGLWPHRSRLPVLRRAAFDVMNQKHLIADSKETYVVDARDKVIGKSLFATGEFDFRKLMTAIEVMERRGEKCELIVDVGANIGSIVIPAVGRGYFSRGVAIEPHPHNFRLLRANIILNGLDDKIIAFNCAAGQYSNESLSLMESLVNSGNHMIGSGTLKVSSHRVDDMVKDRSNVLLWMDVEGYEAHVLSGAHELLMSGAPTVLEYNPAFLNDQNTLLLVEDLLAGRDLYDLNQGARRTDFKKLRARYSVEGQYTDILALA